MFEILETERATVMRTRSQHIWQQRNVAPQLNNIYSVFDCTSHVFAPIQLHDNWLWLSGYVSMKRAMTVRQSRKPPKHRLSPRSSGPSSAFVFKLSLLTVETLICFVMFTAANCVMLFAVALSQYTRVTDRRQTTSYDNNSGTSQCNGNVPLKTEIC